MAEPLVLAVDTSTAVTVGLARGRTVLARAVSNDKLAHVEQLVPLLDQALGEAEVTLAAVGAVVVGLGPGPFTGLRVGIVSAQVLADVRGVPLHGVCSLDVIGLELADELSTRGAQSCGVGPAGFVVASDARRREVYWARYALDGTRVGGPAVCSPDEVPALPTVGPGADLYPDRLHAVRGPRRLDPGLLAARGLSLPDAGREPLYLRRPDAAEPTRRKSVLNVAHSSVARRGPAA